MCIQIIEPAGIQLLDKGGINSGTKCRSAFPQYKHLHNRRMPTFSLASFASHCLCGQSDTWRIFQGSWRSRWPSAVPSEEYHRGTFCFNATICYVQPSIYLQDILYIYHLMVTHLPHGRNVAAVWKFATKTKWNMLKSSGKNVPIRQSCTLCMFGEICSNRRGRTEDFCGNPHCHRDLKSSKGETLLVLNVPRQPGCTDDAPK